MITEFHCPCGAHQPVRPEKLKKPIRCSQCGTSVTFLESGNGHGEIAWLTVGGQQGPPRLAVPVPTGLKLAIGAASDCWLALPGEGVDPRQAEVKLGEGPKLSVRHVGADGRTWINKSRIMTGVLNAGDTLRIGPYHMRLRTPDELAALAAEAEPEVIVEDDPDGPEPEPLPKGRQPRESAFSDEPIDIGWSPGQKARAAVCSLLILAAGAYLARTFLWPAAGSDMPDQTEYRCPVDGTKFRAGWAEVPKCPQCGQLCVGAMKYKSETEGGFRPTSAPTSAPSSAPVGKPPSAGGKKSRRGG